MKIGYIFRQDFVPFPVPFPREIPCPVPKNRDTKKSGIWTLYGHNQNVETGKKSYFVFSVFLDIFKSMSMDDSKKITKNCIVFLKISKLYLREITHLVKMATLHMTNVEFCMRQL